MTRTRLGRIGLALALVATSGLAMTGGAAAANCGKAKERYHVTEADSYPAFEGKRWKSGPGGEVSASLERTFTFATTVNGSAGAEARKVFAKISGQFGFQVKWERSEKQGYSYSHPVPPDRWGHLQYFNEMWKTRWLRYIDFERCPDEWVEEGEARVVSNEAGYYYWETPDGHGDPPPMKSRHYDGGWPSQGTET